MGFKRFPVGLLAILIAAPVLAAPTVTLNLSGFVESGGGNGPPYIQNGDAVAATIVFYTESFGSSAPYPQPLGNGDPANTFYWFPQSVHWVSGGHAVALTPIAPYLLPAGATDYTVVQNDFPAGTDFIDGVSFVVGGAGGYSFSMYTGTPGGTGGPLGSGSMVDAVARADAFEQSTLTLPASNYTGNPAPMVVRFRPVPSPVPEPPAWLLWALGLAAGLGSARLRGRGTSLDRSGVSLPTEA